MQAIFPNPHSVFTEAAAPDADDEECDTKISLGEDDVLGAVTEVSDDEPPEGCNADGADTEVSDDELPEGCNEESGGYDMSYSSSSS